MCSALGSILGLIIGGSLYEEIGINWTMNIYSFLSLLMGIIFFLMNIWPGFLLSPVLDLPESELGLGIPINNANPGQSVRMTRQIQDALDEKAHENRLVLSVRGSVAGDIIFPVTNEQKIFLAGIDEEDDDDESSVN